MNDIKHRTIQRGTHRLSFFQSHPISTCPPFIHSCRLTCQCNPIVIRHTWKVTHLICRSSTVCEARHGFASLVDSSRYSHPQIHRRISVVHIELFQRVQTLQNFIKLGLVDPDDLAAHSLICQCIARVYQHHRKRRKRVQSRVADAGARVTLRGAEPAMFVRLTDHQCAVHKKCEFFSLARSHRRRDLNCSCSHVCFFFRVFSVKKRKSGVKENDVCVIVEQSDININNHFFNKNNSINA
jgi:hypothetical protein